MTGGLYRASAAEIQQLQDDPASVHAFIEASGWAPPLREVRPKGLLGWLLKLTPVTIHETDPEAVPPPGYNPEDDRPGCDLDKEWQGLHFLFTGTAWDGEEPGCYLISGGDEVGEPDDLGYTVLQTLSPAQMRRFAEFLGSLSRPELERRFDPTRMMALKIYPDIWTRSADEHGGPFEHLVASFDRLRAFVETTAAAGHGALVYVA